MHALIDQLAAPGELRVRAPLAVVADAPAVPVACPDEHERPERARVRDLPRLLKRRMKAVVVARADDHALLLRQRIECIRLACAERDGFFDKHVFAGTNRVACERGKRGVHRRDNHGIHVG